MKKICVVTGGSSGIGEATVMNFLSEGYQVYNLDIKGSGVGKFIPCNISSPTEVQNSFDYIRKDAGRIDHLVISAGIHITGNVETTSLRDFSNVIDVNVRGAYLSLHYGIALMKDKGGSIVLVSSEQALVGKKNSFVYNLSKAALAAMAKTIATDYASYGIRCTAVCPGTIDTPLYRKAIENAAKRENDTLEHIHQNECDMQLLRRIGTAKEVAELISFLCSDKAKFITGATYVIDGGYTTV